MAQMGLWQINGGRPQALQPSRVDLEAQIEDWIEQDPDLLQRGLTIVGRQIHVDGGILDLLAVDPQGNWVIIEIKRGTVYRDTVTQALDYTASIARMPYESLARKVQDNLKLRGKNPAILTDLDIDEDAGSTNRDVSIFVVGTNKAPDLDRIVGFLAERSDLAINVVTFEVFELASGERVLLRELTEADFEEAAESTKPRVSLEDLVDLAERHGNGSHVRALLSIAERLGFYARPYKQSIMFTPQQNKGRMLYTVRVKTPDEGLVNVYTGPQAFEEFFGIPPQAFTKMVGEQGWYSLSLDNISDLGESLTSLMDQYCGKVG